MSFFLAFFIFCASFFLALFLYCFNVFSCFLDLFHLFFLNVLATLSPPIHWQHRGGALSFFQSFVRSLCCVSFVLFMYLFFLSFVLHQCIYCAPAVLIQSFLHVCLSVLFAIIVVLFIHVLHVFYFFRSFALSVFIYLCLFYL